MSKRRRLAPEVVQSSVMDCGPAALSCLLEGYGIRASYDRLREACQTDVDGTSIDTLEEVARELGLDAEQIMIPADHLARPGSASLPALVVVLLPSGATHFVILWGRAGKRVQVMDPATGRRWPSVEAFRSEVYPHTFEVPAEEWCAWAAGSEFAGVLKARLAELGLGRQGEKELERALARSDWFALAVLDAACRMTSALVHSRAVRRGREAGDLLRGLVDRAHANPDRALHVIPGGYWYARRGSEPGKVTLRGAVIVRVRGRRSRTEDLRSADRSAELDLVLEEPRPRIARTLAGLVRARSALAPRVLLGGFLLAALGVMVQALLLRGLIDVGRDLALPMQRVGMLALVVVFLVLLTLLELPLARTALRIGRGLEADLRVAFQTGVARLADRYLRSRPASDMAERAHSIVLVAGIGTNIGELVRLGFQLLLTAAGIAWLDPAMAPVAAVAVVFALVLPLFSRRLLVEQELSVRNLRGALSRVYLESLLGLVPLRTHGAERVARREHAGILGEWSRASLRLRRSEVLLSAAQSMIGLGLVVALVTRHFAAAEGGGATLLLCFWALAIPGLGNEIVTLVQRFPTQENVARRLLEPVSREEATARARERSDPVAEGAAAPLATTALRAAGPHMTSSVSGPVAEPGEGEAPAGESGPVTIEMRGVRVVAGGHPILEGVDLEIPAGEHVAIVGRSGAGKSTLVGLFLGFAEPTEGTLGVDGEPLHGRRLDELRRATAWVDPSVQLFNRTLLENLRFGSEGSGAGRIGDSIEHALLLDVLANLPNGLQSKLGEGGGLLSGGEGQRVRLARAACRDGVRLAILDEPFRGLERERRHELLIRARELWSDATLLCVTHDLAETTSFDRIIVVADGRVVEVGTPDELRGRATRYSALLEAEKRLEREVWGDPSWRHVHLVGGSVREVIS